MEAITENLDGKAALITGASSGIGEQTAKALAESGASVALAARREDELQQLADEIETEGGETLVVPTDVTDEDDVAEMVDRTHEEFGSVDVLVNNAGVMLLEHVEDADTDNFRQMVEVNLLGLIDVTHEVLPYMQDQGEGHIVNISSVAGRKAMAGGAGYNATKFGVNGFTEALRQEVTGENDIRTTLIEPGFVETELADHIPDDEQQEQTKEAYEQMDVLQPEDIARSIAFAVGQPTYVDVNELLIRPTSQEL